MNKNNDILIYLRKNVSTPEEDVKKKKQVIPFDIESFITIDEKWIYSIKKIKNTITLF